jgi:hypothetical protein
MAKAIFNDDNHDEEAPEAEVTETRESEEIVPMPIPDRPCRNENAHEGHYWNLGDDGYYCVGRQRA